jgi:hypothetical protein
VNVTIYPGRPSGVNFEAASVVKNIAGATVQYCDTEDPFISEGSIAVGASQTLTGTYYFSTPATALLSYTPLGPTTDAQIATLGERIGEEEVARAEADDDLTDLLTAESATRGAADTALDGRLDTLESSSTARSALVPAPTGVAATDTAAAQAAASTLTVGGRLEFRAGAYAFNAKVTLPHPDVEIIGQGDGVTTITQSSPTESAFSYLSPIEGATSTTLRNGPKFRRLRINARYAIEINQSGTFATIFDRQGYVAAVALSHVTLNGHYATVLSDASMDTTTVPSVATLDAFGIGVRAAKCFNMHIGEGVVIQGYGVGARLDGCDIVQIDSSARFVGNARHVYAYGHDTYGGSLKIKDCDILYNRRVGAIMLEGTAYALIRDNYFETPTVAALYVMSNNDVGTQFTGNRLTDVATKILSFAPNNGLKVENNVLQLGVTGVPTSTVELLDTNAATANQLAVWRNNGRLADPAPKLTQASTIASAATITLPDSDSTFYTLTGTTAVAHITPGQPGRVVQLYVQSGVTFTHAAGGTGFLLGPGGANVVAPANSLVEIVQDGIYGVWYLKAPVSY